MNVPPNKFVCLSSLILFFYSFSTGFYGFMRQALIIIHMRRFPYILALIFSVSLIGCWHQPIEKLNWQTYKLDESGVSIDLPYPIEVKKNEKKANANFPIKKIHGYSHETRYLYPGFLKEEFNKLIGKKQKPIFFTFGAYTDYEKSDKKYNLEDIANKCVISFNRVYRTPQNKNFILKKEPYKNSGLSGIMITDSSEDYAGNYFECFQHSSFICLTKGNQLWKFFISYTTNDETADPELASSAVDRIIQSIKIEAK